MKRPDIIAWSLTAAAAALMIAVGAWGHYEQMLDHKRCTALGGDFKIFWHAGWKCIKPGSNPFTSPNLLHD